VSSTEAAFSVTEKNAKGNLCTVRGSNFAEFRQNLSDMLGAEGAAAYLNSFLSAFGAGVEAQAMQTVQTVIPNSQPAAAPAAPAAQPAGDVPPVGGGNCAHGPRVYSDKPARGKPWRRWECSIPWSKDNQAQRCKPVNIND
jgi:hypothetical protein